MNPQETYQKALISIRYFLIGAKMYNASAALEFALKLHTGMRKDGVTPAFSHQLQIMQFMRTLPDLDDPESVLAVTALHDTPEDADVGHLEIERRFGNAVSVPVKALTKTHRGQKVETFTYYAGIAENCNASSVKGGDRIHNLGSMTGVFTRAKQSEYIEETETHVLPLLKQARRNFPRQEAAFLNEKFVLQSQIALLKATLDASSATTNS